MVKDAASVPDIEYVRVSPSASEAVMVPTAVWFSFISKDEDEVNIGRLSLRFSILITKSLFTVY